jgi:hypothetical protein
MHFRAWTEVVVLLPIVPPSKNIPIVPSVRPLSIPPIIYDHANYNTNNNTKRRMILNTKYLPTIKLRHPLFVLFIVLFMKCTFS